MLSNFGAGEDFESPLASKKIEPVNSKGDQPWIFIERSGAEADSPILWPPDAKSWIIWKYPDAGKDWGQEEKGMTEWDGWMASLTQWTWVWATPGGSEGQGILACCSPWGHKESDRTEQMNWTETLDYRSVLSSWITKLKKTVLDLKELSHLEVVLGVEKHSGLVVRRWWTLVLVPPL